MNPQNFLFVWDMMKNKNLTSSQSRRIVQLLEKEIGKRREDEVLEIAQLEMLRKYAEHRSSYIATNIVESYPYSDPRETTRFLMAYNQHPVLKTTTHEIDSNQMQVLLGELGLDQYDFQFHLSAIHDAFNEMTERYNVRHTLKRKFYSYLFGTVAGWSEQKIKNNWNAPYLSAWTLDHPGHCPNPSEKTLKYEGYRFNYEDQIATLDIYSFLDLVYYFKKHFAIRFDNNLQTLCKEWLQDFEGEITYESDAIQRNIQFFTDVEKLNQAVRNIIRMCVEESPKEITPHFVLGLKETKNEHDEATIVFSIHHRNTVFKKTAQGLFRNKGYGEKFTNIIKNQINGLCDWHLTANFGKDSEGILHYGSVCLWPYTEKVEEIHSFEGACFELVFYK